MSKPIKFDNTDIEKIVDDFKESLQKTHLFNGEIKYQTKILVNAKAKLIFTNTAFEKMQTLIREFDKEIAWHGIAKRYGDEQENQYIVEDILVYPQTVTAATVTADQEKYQQWIFSQEDEVFNNIRFHGHSHVNMGTSPSSVDLDYQRGILSQLEDDMFYIFAIWNKKGDKTIKIYDMKKNILFENDDITVIVQGNEDLGDFLEDAKEKVEDTKSFSYFNNNDEEYSYYEGVFYE